MEGLAMAEILIRDEEHGPGSRGGVFAFDQTKGSLDGVWEAAEGGGLAGQFMYSCWYIEVYLESA